jgi:hypothetical protein
VPRLIAILILSLALAGCADQAVQTVAPPAPTPGAAAGSSAPVASSAPSVAPSGVLQAKLGDNVSITCGGSDCLDVTVDKAQFATHYVDPQHYLDDIPQTKGDVFLAFHVIEKATGPNATYSLGDWAVYNDNALSDTISIASHGPKPALLAGALPVGKSVSGWIIEEVPAKGQVVIAYQPLGNEVFEISVRPS